MYCRSKIAVVDDESELAQLYTESLDANGYEATAFSNSSLALEEICSNHTNYSMVISDDRMPGLNGMELLTQIQQKDDGLDLS
jgi:DNA-binding NtrC family response regulator